MFIPLPGRWLQGGVVVSLLLAAMAAQYTYRMYWGNPKLVARVAVLETAAVLALLVPTGGMDSVFIWYAMNPMLVAAVTLPVWWSPAALTAFLGAAALLTPDVAGRLGPRLQTALIYVLVTVAAQILAMINRLTQRHNAELQERGARLQRALDVQAALYALIRRLATAQTPAEIAQVAAAAGQSVLGARTVAVRLDGEAPAVAGAALADDAVAWLTECAGEPSKLAGAAPAAPGVTVHPIAAGETPQGAIIAFGDGAPPGDVLRGIADLISFALQRIGLEQTRQRLAIAAEKQRIAGELHDVVAQKLFSISTALYALQQHADPAVSQQAGVIGQVAQQAARELRLSIDGLAARGGGEASLLETVRSYLATLKLMHGVSISYQETGHDRRLSPKLQRALFRILQEASGNALSHGQCTELAVSLLIGERQCRLRIADNGRGFSACPGLVRGGEAGRGYGLANMRALVLRWGGDLDLVSNPGSGTVVTVTIPLTFRPVPALAGKEA